MDKKLKILYLSPIAYEDLKQRPQYIAEKLAERHDVVYVEPTLRLVSYITRKVSEYKGKIEQVSEHLTIVRCNGAFVIPFRWKMYDILGIGSIAERYYLKKYIKQADVIIVGYEGWTDLLTGLSGKKIIYDKMDDNVLLTPEITVKHYLKKMEAKLLLHTVCMVVTAQKFLDDYIEKVDKIVRIPNGVDVAVKKNIDLKRKEKVKAKVFGYIGMISEWFDMNALKIISEQNGLRITMVGPCNTKKYENYNIIYEGKIPKSEVGNKIQTFDVCLYPFKKGELLDTINPVKIYEYLACNKPVIAVDCKETRKFGDLIYRYRNEEELKILCNKKLKKPFNSEQECIKYIEENSWGKRVDQFEKILEEL